MLNVKREQSERSRETLAAYAADRWPVIGVMVAVQIVGGCEKGVLDEDCKAESGKVVNRIPADTISPALVGASMRY